MKNDQTSELVEPFDIDDGSINGLKPEYAFAMGVEWQLFRQKLETGRPFKTLCLPQNTRRLFKSLF
jgi:hypothetical protein